MQQILWQRTINIHHQIEEDPFMQSWKDIDTKMQKLLIVPPKQKQGSLKQKDRCFNQKKLTEASLSKYKKRESSVKILERLPLNRFPIAVCPTKIERNNFKKIHSSEKKKRSRIKHLKTTMKQVVALPVLPKLRTTQQTQRDTQPNYHQNTNSNPKHIHNNEIRASHEEITDSNKHQTRGKRSQTISQQIDILTLWQQQVKYKVNLRCSPAIRLRHCLKVSWEQHPSVKKK